MGSAAELRNETALEEPINQAPKPSRRETPEYPPIETNTKGSLAGGVENKETHKKERGPVKCRNPGLVKGVGPSRKRKHGRLGETIL